MKILSTIVFMWSFIFAFSTVASADFVKFFYNEQNGNNYFINLKSIQRQHDRTIAWCRNQFRDSRSYGGFSSVELKMQADCRHNKLQALKMVAYNKEGRVLSTDSIVTALPLDPGTPNYMVFKIICGKKTPKQTLKHSVHL